MKIEKRTQKFIERTLKKQKMASEKARVEFEKSSDPEIVIRFIKKSQSGAAIQEPWVCEAIQKWIRNDQHDLLKSAFLPRRGERDETRTRAKERMMFAERIDRNRRAGISLKEALASEAKRNGTGSEGELAALKNKYYRAKRIRTEITIKETAESFIIAAFPAKVTLGGLPMFGEWKITLPKK
jgi:hypothetical protein